MSLGEASDGVSGSTAFICSRELRTLEQNTIGPLRERNTSPLQPHRVRFSSDKMTSLLVFIVAILLCAPSVDCTPCDATLSGSSSGFVSSLNFSAAPFPPGLTCSWTIIIPSGRIKLTFHNFSLEPNGLTDCSRAQGARITITNVASHDLTVGPNFQLCGGQEIPAPVYSFGNFTKLTLVSSSNPVSGFNASYETVTDEMLCPAAALETEMSGEITSPFYPRNYPNDQNCRWTVQASIGKRIKLEVIDMLIENCGDEGACTCDYLNVLDGYNSDGGSPSGKACVDRSFQVLTYYSVHNALNLEFFSDGGIAVNRHRGFRANYTHLNYTPPVCPSFAIPLSGGGTFSSPNYPKFKYPASRNCSWNITATAGKSVMVTITKFAMGICDDCSSDICSRVEFYDGPTQNSPSLGRFCNGSQLTPKISSGNQMYVHFRSGFSLDLGFEANYAETDTPTSVKSSPEQPTTAVKSSKKPPNKGAAVLSITLLLVILPSFAATMLWP